MTQTAGATHSDCPPRIMSVTVQVALLSGRALHLEAELDSTIDTFKRKVQTAFTTDRGRLLDSACRVLDVSATVRECGLHPGVLLTWHVGRVQVAANFNAAAAILSDGAVATWGHPNYGGDSSSVQERLKHVRQIHSRCLSFAAILDDGSVVAWGNPRFGGNCDHVQHELRNVQHVQGSYGAFAATRGDGSVVTWGNPDRGGDSTLVQRELKNVKHIQATLVAEQVTFYLSGYRSLT